MHRQPRLRNFLTGIGACLLLGSLAQADAAVRQTHDGYEVSYEVTLAPEAAHGDIEVFIFEWDGEQLSVQPGRKINGSGQTVLKHRLAFAPKSALVIGYGDGVDDEGNPRKHLYTLVSPALAKKGEGVKFSQVFGRGEKKTVKLVMDAARGSVAALAELTEFVTQQSDVAPFDPNGKFVALRWTAGTVVSVPEPGTLALLAVGLTGLGAASRRRNK